MHEYFDARRRKLASFGVESVGRLGIVGSSNFIVQLATSIMGIKDVESTARNRVAKEHLLQIISVTTQVVILWRASPS